MTRSECLHCKRQFDAQEHLRKRLTVYDGTFCTNQCAIDWYAIHQCEIGEARKLTEQISRQGGTIKIAADLLNELNETKPRGGD